MVHIRLGNCSTKALTQRLLSEEQTIKEFMADPNESLLVIA